MDRCEAAFAGYGGTGKLVDQAFTARLGHGIIRAYLVGDQVGGFARQYPKDLSPQERAAGGIALGAEVPADGIMGLPSAKTMFPRATRPSPGCGSSWKTTGCPGCGPSSAWTPGRCRRCGTPTSCSAPGHPTGTTATCCEINASSVSQFPPEAVPLLARVTREAVTAARSGR
jgi:hypothetical protein